MHLSQPQPLKTARVFAQKFSATPRGARLARHLTAWQLDTWGIAYGSPLSENTVLLVAELTTNAAVHGRVPGRDFELRLSWQKSASVVRIEVSDTHESLPSPRTPNPETEDGRGLFLVDALAARWGVCGRTGPGKTVWADVSLP